MDKRMFDPYELEQRFIEKMNIQRYAPNTQKTYSLCIRKFLRAFHRYDLTTVGERNIENYILHLLEMGTDIRLIQELLGHTDIKTTEIYTRVTDVSKPKIKSPLDGL